MIKRTEKRATLVAELKRIQREIDVIINDNTDTVMITALREKSEEIPNKHDEAYAQYNRLGDHTTHVMLEDFPLTQDLVLPKGAEIIISGAIVSIVDKRVIAEPQEEISITITEPQIITELMEAKANTTIRINDMIVAYTQGTVEREDFKCSFRTENRFIIESATDILHVIFEPDHMVVCSASTPDMKELDAERDLIVQSLILTFAPKEA